MIQLQNRSKDWQRNFTNAVDSACISVVKSYLRDHPEQKSNVQFPDEVQDDIEKRVFDEFSDEILQQFESAVSLSVSNRMLSVLFVLQIIPLGSSTFE